MDIVILMLFVILSGVKCATNVSEEEQLYTYNAAVVEYYPTRNNSIPLDERLILNTNEYLNLLNSITEDIELILFPEMTLTSGSSQSSEVPDPFGEIICNSTDSRYQDYLKQFSCAAIEHNTTVIVNIEEKFNCTSNNATGYCPSDGIVYHNTDVAFNESGGVSGRYRKWNLFGEYSRQPPAEMEIVTITTKNNNTFGIFTCFDIIFAEPALNYTRNLGLKNILFPTMWFSELPFLTALQVQQMWAQENNVNFLSAGANYPPVGSGGTGIFVGEKGPLAREIVGGEGGTKLIVKRVPRLDIANNPYDVVTPLVEDIDALALEMDSFALKTDPSLINYTSIVLDTNQTDIKEEVCNGEEIVLCCQFDLKISVNQSIASSSKDSYIYQLAAFSGVRSFDGVANGGIESCSVVACLNESLASCGQRFSNYSTVVWPVTFESVSVVANFSKSENRIQYPNSLLASIRPILPQLTIWSREEFNETVVRTHTLSEPQNKLLTFGIYGRDFARDKGSNSSKINISNVLVLSLILLCFLFKK